MATSGSSTNFPSSNSDPISNDTGLANPAAGAMGGSSLGTDHGTPLSGATSSSTGAMDSTGGNTTTRAAGTTGNDLLNRVVQGAHETIDRLAETAAPHVQRLQEGVTSANDTLHTRAGQLRETGDEWAESLRTTVRENPLAAVATALAVGIIISRLTRR